MNRNMLRHGEIAGLVLGFLCLIGCEGVGGGGGEPLPPTGGAGIPGRRGPAADAPSGKPGGEMPGQGPATRKGATGPGGGAATPKP